MKPRPFVLLGESGLRALRERCASAAAQWGVDWGVALDESGLECGPCTPGLAAPGARWSACRVEGEPVAWVGPEGDCEEVIAGAMAGAPMPLAGPERITPLVAHAAREALADLTASLVRALRGGHAGALATEAAELPAELAAPGSGAVVLRIALGAAALRIVVAHEPARPQAAARRGETRAAPVVTALAAAQRASMVVRAQMGSVEVAVAALQGLAPGDVIRLGTRLADPVDLVAPDGSTLCRGHLGAFEGRRALDLVP